MNGASPPLLVFAEDWGRHISGCQHLVRQLLPRYEVFWVNTIGTRRPRFNRATLARGFEKLRHWTHREPLAASQDAKPQAARPHILNPRMWPWFSHRFDRHLNRELLYRQLAPRLHALPEPPVAITKIPLVADLIGQLPVARWVYYCVDDFAEWPGLDHEPLRQMEQRLVRDADVIIAVSETLQTRLAQMGRSSHLLTHGVDVDDWRVAPVPLHDQERPLLVFWGVIDRRLDLDLLTHLDTALKQGTILLIGPHADPDRALFRLRHVRFLEAVAYEQLPGIGAAADVLLMPYADLPVTRAMQPLKLKEYLATGKPVVSRRLPSTRPWADALDVAETAAAFTELVQLRLKSGVPIEQQRARERLRAESWAVKARQFEEWIFGART
jgi:glycosyltransferase involved in cell wall biosynthesis